ncbi:MAG TPA: McrC family protein [bacterium]|nr:McrC family protein [bacterium]HPM45854.1 McrC family protein [bacterium]
MKKQLLTIKEFGFIGKSENKEAKKDETGNIYLPKTEFKSLEDFVLKAREDDEYGCEYLRLGFKKGLDKILTAKNYVGIIETKNHIIEILPKIYKNENDDDNTRKIFLKMLKSLRNLPFRHFNTASLESEKLHLFEIFVRMFLEELGKLVRSGIKSQYVLNEENLNVVKGKIKWSEQIRHNLVHKERIFVEYDEYSVNRPENRIIKTTIEFLARKGFSNNTSRLIRQYQFIFDEIPASFNIEKDFLLCKNNRLVKDYLNLLPWCRVFLKNESFSTVTGRNDVFSLLFPMEKVFESYVADEIRKNIGDGYIVSTQDKSHNLFVDLEKFALRPDIVISKGEEKIILDTKWKVIESISESGRNNISQADLYQMFAYGKKYGAKTLFLIYPENEKFQIYPENEKFQKSCHLKYEKNDLDLYIFPWKFSSNEKESNIGNLINI